jgi:UDP-galactopyranose mutase
MKKFLILLSATLCVFSFAAENLKSKALFPVKWEKNAEPYYPINDEKNSDLYQKYLALAQQEKNVIFGGRLGHYKYYDMDKVIAEALILVDKENCC